VATDLRRLTEDVATAARAATGRDCEVDTHAQGAAGVDPRRVEQALLRLAANAARFAPAGEPIRIGSSRDDATVRFWVSDQGPGLADGDAERVFERFARGSDDGTPDGRAPADGAGPGLGLAVVRAVADAHQGSAYVDSRPGEGATFGLELPVQALPEGAVRAAPVAAPEKEPVLR
jgi:signal transduction histidine kinase